MVHQLSLKNNKLKEKQNQGNGEREAVSLQGKDVKHSCQCGLCLCRLMVARTTVVPSLCIHVVFSLIIANMNKCRLALYTCLACKSTLIRCAEIEGKSNLPFQDN